jgi:hypothetical protein
MGMTEFFLFAELWYGLTSLVVRPQVYTVTLQASAEEDGIFTGQSCLFNGNLLLSGIIQRIQKDLGHAAQ